jgi:uncharacterized protein YjbI with pentapeptide repeats
MNGGTAGGANFLGAKLTRAKFTNVDFATLRPEIGYANLDQAADLQDAVFENVEGFRNIKSSGVNGAGRSSWAKSSLANRR